MTEEIEWEDPPDGIRGKLVSRRREVASALRANPGRWAIVYRAKTHAAAATFASLLRGGRDKSFGAGFDASVSDNVVYARYVGEA
jgi:hypothetical protein